MRITASADLQRLRLSSNPGRTLGYVRDGRVRDPIGPGVREDGFVLGVIQVRYLFPRPVLDKWCSTYGAFHSYHR